MKLFYLVHDLNDAAVRRRSRFLRQGGATVSIAGFRRLADEDRPRAEGLSIDVTRNGRLLQRAFAASRAIVFSRRWRDGMVGADVLIARNLEMLAVAVVVRRLVRLKVPVVYECLDIHSLLTRRDAAGWILRRIERALLGSSALLLTSSPAFLTEYFQRYHAGLPPSLVLENKLLADETLPSDERAERIAPVRPWRIGWFGIIRCRRSLTILAELVRSLDGLVEVEIRGRPARDVIGDFDAVVARTDGLSYCGSYDRATDLSRLYAGVHFNWTIDYYEAGENSSWLLPNRLYEGSALGAVPIALAGVATGRWLARRECGVLLAEPLDAALPVFFKTLTAGGYADLQQRVAELRTSDLVETEEAAAAFVARLLALTGENKAAPIELERAA